MTQGEPPLAGRVALVTGASSGLGRALALELARRGARLVLAARDRDRLSRTAREALVTDPADVLVQPTDLTRRQEVEALAAAAQRAFGGLDILVNNAGLGRADRVIDSDPGEVESMIQVNLWGLYLVTRFCLPLMLGRESGQVVNISSVAASNPSPGFAMYAATKAAVSSFSQSLRQELRGEGIRVLDVCPGMTDTAFFAGFAAGGKSPLPLEAGPLLKPSEVATAVADAICLPPNAAVNQLTIRPAWQER